MTEPDDTLPIVYVCQARGCKRFDTPRKFVRRWWLIAPRKDDPNWLVIRCPQHYTEAALRQTIYGRLDTLVTHAAVARHVKLPPVDPLAPMPIRYLGAHRGSAQDDVPDPHEFLDRVVRQPKRTKWKNTRRSRSDDVCSE